LPAEIVVVSGLPRSGTSMMMQMLAAGGLETASDGLRTADDDNPRGYFELERVKQLKHDSAWLAAATGKAVKVVSQHLFDLPATESYRVIFMDRDLAEVIASQEAMIARRGTRGAASDKMSAAFENHLVRVKSWLAGRNNMRTHFASYVAILADPHGEAATVNEFLGGELDVAAMAAAVDPALYRNRRDR
jgi:hypothetical protein